MKHDILIVSENDHLKETLQVTFQDNFRLHFAETDKEIINSIFKIEFQFIILNINSPGKVGIEMCLQLNKMDLARQPQIIILGVDSNEDIMREAYELGIADYVCKPLNINDFKNRVLRVSNEIEKIYELERLDKDVKDIAETVMKQAAAYGNGLELLGRLNNCRMPEDFANELLSFMYNQGFNAAVQLRSQTHTYSFDVDEVNCSDIEKKIFDLFEGAGRIYHFGKRSIFNDKHTSMLIKNMPLKGTRSYDVLLDLLAKLIPAIDARFISICEHQVLLNTREALNDVLTSIGKNLQDFEREKQDLVTTIASKVSAICQNLQLNAAQKASIIDFIEKELVQISIWEHLDDIRNSIAYCAETLIDVEESQPQTPKEGHSSTDEIELFD